MSDNSAPEQPRTAKLSPPITLAEPIVRGAEKITVLQLRKPKGGELRGLSIQELMNARASAILDILPRITMPPITQAEADQLEAEDLAACSGAVIDFFLTPADRRAVERVLNA